MDFALFLLVLALVTTWVSRPLRRGAVAADGDQSSAFEREARLAAVRDSELDAQMGKLSEQEHRELDAQLRAEAIAAMRGEEHG
jgi:hypothetical protein